MMDDGYAMMYPQLMQHMKLDWRWWWSEWCEGDNQMVMLVIPEMR